MTIDDNVGFIGLGAMGLPMARNLLDAGIRLKVYNRTVEKADPLRASGAQVATRPVETVSKAGVLITMLADDRALESIIDENLLRAIGNGGVHVSMSTIAPQTARRLAELHARHGVAYLSAPVFGRPDAAAAGKLVICTSGPKTAKERVQHVLKAMGQALFDFGEEPAAANVVKLSGNFLIAAAMEAMAEAFTMAEKNSIDRAALAEMLTHTLFACPVYQNYGAKVAAHQYTPAGFRLVLGLKDVDLVLQTAKEAQAPMPIASLLHDRLLAALAHGRGDLDWSALSLEVSEAAAARLPRN